MAEESVRTIVVLATRTQTFRQVREVSACREKWLNSDVEMDILHGVLEPETDDITITDIKEVA